MALELHHESDCTVAITSRAMQCSICGEFAHCLVNRDGRTRCYACDADYQDRIQQFLRAREPAHGMGV
jgi:hypothetical protein